jgi:hypothetical protein
MTRARYHGVARRRAGMKCLPRATASSPACALCSATRAVAIIASSLRRELARALLYDPTMTNTLMIIEAEQLVTATGGAGKPVSFIEPTLRQTFKGKELEHILTLPIGQQARILNAQLHCNAGK